MTSDPTPAPKKARSTPSKPRGQGSSAKTSTKVNALKASERTRSAAERFKDMTARRAAASASTPLVRATEADVIVVGAGPKEEASHEPALSLVPAIDSSASALTEPTAAIEVGGAVDREPEAPNNDARPTEQSTESEPAARDMAKTPGAEDLGDPDSTSGRASPDVEELVPQPEDSVDEDGEPAPAEPRDADGGGDAGQSPTNPTAQRRTKSSKPSRTVENLVEATSGPECRLERSGEPIKKMTLDLPIPLVDVLSRLELDTLKNSGRRLYRERIFDMALAALPEDPDEVIEIGANLPGWLKYAETEQVGARAREALILRMRTMPVEMKVRRTKGVYLRYIYTAALVNLLASYGVEVNKPDA
jgi:hypothetical protein